MEKQEYFSLYCSQHTYRWRNLDRKIYKKIKSNGLTGYLKNYSNLQIHRLVISHFSKKKSYVMSRLQQRHKQMSYGNTEEKKLTIYNAIIVHLMHVQ